LPEAAEDRAKNSNQNGFVRMARAAVGSLLFLALAPGVVAGLVSLLQPRLVHELFHALTVVGVACQYVATAFFIVRAG
jgi:predicted membrane channel-forming protein YqfA (hemolysin III family)